ncbi:hypothetical protein AHAS_Ahas15G0199800 [Arachis hypogaea]
MTTLIKEIHQGQKASQSIQAIQAPPQILQLEGPPRVCGLCSSTSHYTDQCHQVQEDYTLAVANNYNNWQPYQSQGQSNYSHAEILARLALPPTNNTNTNQASSSSSLPSQPIPHPKSSINAITLRSGTTLEKVEPKPIKLAEDVPNIEVGETTEIDKDKKEEEVFKLEETLRQPLEVRSILGCDIVKDDVIEDHFGSDDEIGVNRDLGKRGLSKEKGKDPQLPHSHRNKAPNHGSIDK